MHLPVHYYSIFVSTYIITVYLSVHTLLQYIWQYIHYYSIFVSTYIITLYLPVHTLLQYICQYIHYYTIFVSTYIITVYLPVHTLLHYIWQYIHYYTIFVPIACLLDTHFVMTIGCEDGENGLEQEREAKWLNSLSRNLKRGLVLA